MYFLLCTNAFLQASSPVVLQTPRKKAVLFLAQAHILNTYVLTTQALATEAKHDCMVWKCLHALQVAGVSSSVSTILQQQAVLTTSSAVVHLPTDTAEQTSPQQHLQSQTEPSSQSQQLHAEPPAPACMAQLEDAFHAEYHSTHDPLCRAVLCLLYCDLAATAWQRALQEEQRADAAARGFQEICRRRQEKVRVTQRLQVSDLRCALCNIRLNCDYARLIPAGSWHCSYHKLCT
jgi:hypothetical protein